MALKIIKLRKKLTKISEQWSPKIVAESEYHIFLVEKKGQ
jgi:hypothetical protein